MSFNTFLYQHRVAVSVFFIILALGLVKILLAFNPGLTTDLISKDAFNLDSRTEEPAWIGKDNVGSALIPPYPDYGYPAPDSMSRMQIKTVDLSLVVKDVPGSADQITNFAKNQGGFMIVSSYTQPEESPYGSVTVKVPTAKLDETLKFIRNLGVKVISEINNGTDVTDTYYNANLRLGTLKETEAKYKELLRKAATVEDILKVQNELTNVEAQIESLEGEADSIKKNVDMTTINVSLATDELALPYTPDESFRPQAIFKQAVRSLVTSARSLVELGIWAAVYAVIWVPLLLIGYLLWRKFHPKTL